MFALFLTPAEAVVLSASLTLLSNLLTVRTFWAVVPYVPYVPYVAIGVDVSARHCRWDPVPNRYFP